MLGLSWIGFLRIKLTLIPKSSNLGLSLTLVNPLAKFSPSKCPLIHLVGSMVLSCEVKIHVDNRSLTASVILKFSLFDWAQYSITSSRWCFVVPSCRCKNCHCTTYRQYLAAGLDVWVFLICWTTRSKVKLLQQEPSSAA